MKTKLVKVFVCCMCLTLIFGVTGCGSNTAKKPADTNNNITDTNQTNTVDSDRRMMADRIANLATSVTGVKNAYVVIADAETSNTTDAMGPADTAVPGAVNETRPITENNATSNTGNLTGTTNTNTNTNTTGTTTNPTRENNVTNTAGNRYVALIGIEVDDGTANDTTKRQNIVNEVRDKVKNSETGLMDVLVTTDNSMIKRIQDMAAGLLNGTAVGTTAEVNKLRDDLRAAGNDLVTGTQNAVTGVTNAVKDATGMNR